MRGTAPFAPKDDPPTTITKQTTTTPPHDIIQSNERNPTKRKHPKTRCGPEKRARRRRQRDGARPNVANAGHNSTDAHISMSYLCKHTHTMAGVRARTNTCAHSPNIKSKQFRHNTNNTQCAIHTRADAKDERTMQNRTAKTVFLDEFFFSVCLLLVFMMMMMVAMGAGGCC